MHRFQNDFVPSPGAPPSLQGQDAGGVAGKPPLHRAMALSYDAARAHEAAQAQAQAATNNPNNNEQEPLRMPMVRQPSFASTITSTPELPQHSASTGPVSSSSDETELPSHLQQQQQQQMHQVQQPGAHIPPPPALRHPVFVVWDLTSVPLPVSPSMSWCLERVHALADSHGFTASFKCLALAESPAAGGLSLTARKALADHNVELEEVSKSVGGGGVDLAVLTSILNSLVAAQLQARVSALVLLSNQEALARSLHLLRRSKLFDAVVLVHHSPHQQQQGYGAPLLPSPISPNDVPQALIRNATIAHEWSALLRQGLPPMAGIVFAPPPRGSTPLHNDGRRSSGSIGMHSRSGSFKDASALLNSTSPSFGRQQQPQQMSPYGSTNTSAASSGFVSRAATPTAGSVGGRFSSASSSRSGSISLTPGGSPPAGDGSNRSSMGSALTVPPTFESSSTAISDLSVELMLERLPPQARSFVLAFRSVLMYCENERIIPRESVIRKRLLDTPAGAADVDFEALLSLTVECGIAAVEGTAPQRIIYPAGGPGATGPDASGSTARKFDCADFYQPTQRLTVEQTAELLAWLARMRPEVDRGRFGFAQHLSIHAPQSIRSLPHGVLVELVQLMLNQKILLFRKGRVSVNSNLLFCDLRALSALSVAAKPHTPLLSTIKGPAGQEAAAQLRVLYAQIAPNVDRFNEQRRLNPAFAAPGQLTSSSQSSPGLNGGADALGGASNAPLSIDQFAHVIGAEQYARRNSLPDLQHQQQAQPAPFRAHALRTASAPVSPRAWRPTSVLTGAEQSLPQLEPNWLDDGISLSERDSHDLSFLDDRTSTTAASSQSIRTPRFRPTPLFDVESGASFAQLFAHKVLASKCAQTSRLPHGASTRFPWAPVWHFEMSSSSRPASAPASAAPSSAPSSSVSLWSASCSFDLPSASGVSFHTLSEGAGLPSHPSMSQAMESLAHQMLLHSCTISLTFAGIMEELKDKRRAESRIPSVLRLLHKGEEELVELEQLDDEQYTLGVGSLHSQMLADPSLHLDVLLSVHEQPPMLYSCEQVEIQSRHGPRLVWSVAAQLPVGWLNAIAAASNNSSSSAPPPRREGASTIKDSKLAAKIECASQLLAEVERLAPSLLTELVSSFAMARSNGSSSGGVGAKGATTPSSSASTPSSRASTPTTRLSAKAPAWTPPSVAIGNGGLSAQAATAAGASTSAGTSAAGSSAGPRPTSASANGSSPRSTQSQADSTGVQADDDQPGSNGEDTN